MNLTDNKEFVEILLYKEQHGTAHTPQYYKTLDGFNLVTWQNAQRHKGMHDKLIVATAPYYKARLITMDEQIKKAEIVPVVW